MGDACDCEGDFNCDGSVDDRDARIFKRNQLKTCYSLNPCPHEDLCKDDFDCTGKIDGADEMLFKSALRQKSKQQPLPDMCRGGVVCV